MTNRRRARANARRKQAERARREAAMAARRRARGRRAWIVVGGVGFAVACGALAVTVVHASGQPDAVPTSSATPSTTVEADTGTPTPSPTDEGVELAEGWQSSPAPPDPSYAEDRDWTAELHTNQGDITVTLNGAAAPRATAAFTKLAEAGFYAQTDCHRLVTGGPYLLQCGTGTGTGAPKAGFTFGPLENVPADGVYRAGDVVMVRDPDDAESMSSQFQIVYKDATLAPDAAGGYTVVGTVTDGLSIVEGIAQAGTITEDADGWPAVSVIINEVTIR